MPLIQRKPGYEVLTREAQVQPVGSRPRNIAESNRIKYLRAALQLAGVTFLFGIYALTLVWPSGWAWHIGHHTPHYLQMILGVYATLGIFLLIASRKPLAPFESHLVHGVVQRRTRRNHGSTGFSEP